MINVLRPHPSAEKSDQADMWRRRSHDRKMLSPRGRKGEFGLAANVAMHHGCDIKGKGSLRI